MLELELRVCVVLCVGVCARLTVSVRVFESCHRFADDAIDNLSNSHASVLVCVL